jgi:hypothetical protein
MTEESSRRIDNMAFVVVSFFFLAFVYLITVFYTINVFRPSLGITEGINISVITFCGFVLLYGLIISSYRYLQKESYKKNK